MSKRPKLSERLLVLLKAHPALAGREVKLPKAAQGYWRQHSRGGDYSWSAQTWPAGDPQNVTFIDAVDTMTDCVRMGVLLEGTQSCGWIASRDWRSYEAKVQVKRGA